MTRCLALVSLLLTAPVALAGGPPTTTELFTGSAQRVPEILAPPAMSPADCGHGNCCTDSDCHCGCGGDNQERRFLESDRAFPGFRGPISHPVASKGPRALTEGRFLFVSDYIPSEHPFGGGDFQVYGLQVRAALTERLSFIADKDGILSIHPHNARSQNGWLNIAVGLK